MTQGRRSDSTKNLIAILTVLVGVVLAYLIIDGTAQRSVPTRLGLNEVAGQVSIGGSAPIDPVRVELPPAPTISDATPIPEGLQANEPAPVTHVTGSQALSVGSAVDDGAMQSDQAAQAGVTAVPVDMTAVADALIESEPPAAINVADPSAAAVQAAPDRLVLGTEETTIVARRYVDEAPVSGPEKTSLKLATTFVSATRIVPFAFNRVGMGPDGEAAVRELVPIAMKAERVHVRGRTDSKGTFDVNKQVALERAYTVREKFVAAGVPNEKLGISYCTECFIASNETEAGRRANRRVDVEFIMPAEAVAALPETRYAGALPESTQELSLARSLGSMDRDVSN